VYEAVVGVFGGNGILSALGQVLNDDNGNDVITIKDQRESTARFVEVEGLVVRQRYKKSGADNRGKHRCGRSSRDECFKDVT
jgi:hypothetical protein